MNDKILQHADINAQVNLRPRERIVLTAREMFYHHGIRSVGIEAITEVAGTNKMTLYRHFGSKDDLIVECIQKAVAEGCNFWDELEGKYPGDPKAQLAAWVQNCAERLGSDERGCEMANAAVELAEEDHPARRVIEDAKKRFRGRLAELCERAGLEQPRMVADMLGLLLEGAKISRQSEGAEGPSARFKRMADEIIATVGGQGDKA